jgi:tetratricopeptide (TPR) repeat protein
VHYDYGVLLTQQGKWELAADAYRRACQINPAHAQAHNNLGQLLERTRQFDAALDEYRLAIEGQPTFRLARFNAGRALVALGRPAEAVLELARITEPRDAESPRYLFALSVAQLRSGNRPEALRWATEAKQLAERFGQTELAAAIAEQLGSLK